ncbi:MAG: hypothetical protein ACLUD2_12040 [Clostridium sp.]
MLLDVPREKRDELKEVLDALVADGKVGLSKRGKYGKPEAFTLVEPSAATQRALALADRGGHGPGCIYSGPRKTTKTLCTKKGHRADHGGESGFQRENARRVLLSG